MYITKVELRNWRNFRSASVEVDETTYILGPNASGKSNFLDVFRFLRDVANPKGGGLQQAFSVRGGISRVRCLAARKNPNICIEVTLADNFSGSPKWKYLLEIGQRSGGDRKIIVTKEEVFSYEKNENILQRPSRKDKDDPERLTQTAIEQINENQEFREIAEFFADVLYLHLVPQLLKFGSELAVKKMTDDPFGQGFLESIATVTEKFRKSRLVRIEKILKKVVPKFSDLEFSRDERGQPHLRMRYAHWRQQGGFQNESDFSDGTLRLIALLWTLLESNSVILLEEPELSLHKEIVVQIPEMLQRARKSRKKAGGQIFVSTHSEVLLSSPLIAGQYLTLRPSKSGEGTVIEVPSLDEKQALDAGARPADILLPKTGEGIGKVSDL